MVGDLKKAISGLLESSGNKGFRWQDAIKKLEEQSSISIDASEFAEVVKGMEHEGLVKVTGERDRRMIKKVSSD